MLFLFVRLALKNLGRHTRRTLLTVASVSCGCAVIMWMQSVIHGRNKNMIDVITSTYTGHIQVFHRDYPKTKLANKLITSEEFEEKILPHLGTLAWTVRQHQPTIISSGEDSVPIQLEGIDPEREKVITKISDNLREGSFLSAQEICARKEMVIGRSLAETLNVGVGDKLVALTQAMDGTLGNDLFRVSGIYESGSPEFDKRVAFTHILCSQDLSASSGIHEVVLKPHDITLADAHFTDLSETLTGHAVTTWREAIPAVATMIRYNDALLKMTIFILFTVITLALINTILMNLFERTKEFGVVLSMGMTPNQLRLLIFLECFFLGLIGIAAGTVLGGLAVGYHQIFGFDMSPFFGKKTGTDGFTFDLVIRPIFIWAPYFKIVLLELCFLVAAGIYPAWKVSKLNPIEVMRS